MVTEMEFPDDENGDVLRRMKENGDDLNIARNVDFYFKFYDADAARDFVNQEIDTKNGFNFEINQLNDHIDVVVIKEMVPTYENISNIEENLGDAAICYGGQPDGWGSISIKR